MEESQISQVECFIRAVEVTADGRGSAWGETQSKNDAHQETVCGHMGDTSGDA